MTYYEWSDEQKKAFDGLDNLFWFAVVVIVWLWMFLPIIIKL
jgi:hypothetical protein